MEPNPSFAFVFSQQAQLLGIRHHFQSSKEQLDEAHCYIMNKHQELRPFLD